VFASFIRNDMYFFEQYKTGDINSRLGNDINQAKSAVSNNVTFLLRNLLTIIGNIFVLMFMSWKLTMLVLIIVPIYGLVTIIHNRKTKQFTRDIQDIVA
jgi:ABC-type multidrug transport system fused ATPase/permease subunit